MTIEVIQRETEVLASCYKEHILSVRTRSVELLGRKCEPRLMYTFLGFEVQLGTKRLTCPDMTTARYLRIFGKLGMATIEIPYDPTQTARVIPILEESMKRIDKALESRELQGKKLQRATQRTYRRIRQRLKKAESTALGNHKPPD